MFNLELIISILEGNVGVGVGNYYHWWIMNKYYYSWGMCPHLFFLSVLIPSPIPSLDGWGGWRWRDGGAFDDGRGWWMIIATARGADG